MAAKKKPSLKGKTSDQKKITPADDAPMPLDQVLGTLQAIGQMDFGSMPEDGLTGALHGNPEVRPSLRQATVPQMGSAGMTDNPIPSQGMVNRGGFGSLLPDKFNSPNFTLPRPGVG